MFDFKFDFKEVFMRVLDIAKGIFWRYETTKHRILLLLLVIFGLVLVLWILNVIAGIIAAAISFLTGLLVFIGFVFWDNIKDFLRNAMEDNDHTLRNPIIAEIVARFMFDVFRQSGDFLGEYCILPNDFYEIFIPGQENYLDEFCGTPVLKLYILQKPKKELTDVDLGYIRVALQQRIKSRLQAGYLTGLPWAVPVCMSTPLIKLMAVEQSEMYLHFRIILVNDAVSLNAARMAERPVTLPNPDASDDLF